MGNQRQKLPVAVAHPPPPSPSAKATSKYTNKDGSKFITIPKAGSSATDSAQPSPSLDQSDRKNTPHPDQAGPDSPAPAVNRKKQKRREKAAAKAAAEQAQNNQAPSSPTDSAAPSHDRRSLDVEHDFSDVQYEHDHRGAQMNGTVAPAKARKSRKKKKKAGGAGADDMQSHDEYNGHHDHHEHVHQHGHNHAPHSAHRGPGVSEKKIWNTSSQAERQRIKEFWLGLGEEERKSLVKVEKDAVLKKMKEQQKHTCSCTVCGRKRTAIEEELEGLYDAYYEELEQYAHTGNPNGQGPPMMGSQKHLGPAGSRIGSSRAPPSHYPHQPSHGRIMEHVSDDEDDDDEEDYGSEEELDEDDGYDEDEPPEVNSRDDYAKDFFTFGQSLTVQGGILTVADDLLKNDGRKFIEMMEQLAERRMQREEEAKDAYNRNYGHTNGGGYGHSHPPPEEEEYEEDEEEYEDDDDEDYDSQEEEQDAMTEEQRMEEGRRMFQIFAARMFEQRVLAAYKEKVAQEKRDALLAELDQEKLSEAQRREKKARDAQKRKEKAAKKKEALAEEKARKEAEKAAEEAARKAEEERKAAEQRQKAEEKRKRKEEQKKAEEQERLRKEAERQKQKEKQAEQERKAREAKEKEKKAREEAARQKEREAKERREQEARERKEQQEREKREREARSKTDREVREKSAQAQAQHKVQQILPTRPAETVVQKPTAAPPTATPITLVKRPAQHTIPTAVPALPQQPPASAAAVASPQIAVATPAIPKAPLSMRNRQPSQQESTSGSSQSTSQSESNPSQAPSPHPLTPSHTSPGPLGPTSKMGAQQPQPQMASPMNMTSKTAIPPPFGGFAFGQVPPGMPPLPPPGFASPMHQNSAFSASPFSHFANPVMGGLPASMNRPPPGRSFGHPPPPPGFSGSPDSPFPGMGPGFQAGPPRDPMSMPHQRQGSVGLDHSSPSMAPSQPIGKPVPIGRPPSVAPGPRPAASLPNAGWGGNFPETRGLGSSALLADSEEAPQDFPTSARRNTSGLPPGMSFPSMSNMEPSGVFNSPWTPAGQPSFYGSPPPPGLAAQAPWPTTSGQASSAFGLQNGSGRQNRSVTVRQLLCHACRDVAESPGTAAEDRLDDTGYVSLKAVKNRIDQRLPQQEPTTDRELVDICETLGDAGNGGGSFDVRTVAGQTFVRWMQDGTGVDRHPLQRAPIGAPGQIGSPASGPRSFPSGIGH